MEKEELQNLREVKPAGFKEVFVFGEPHELFVLTNDEEVITTMNTKKCFTSANKKKRIGKGEDDTGAHTEGQTYKKTTYSKWIVQRRNAEGEFVLEGPYVNKEMRNLLYADYLRGTNVKRDCDQAFLPFEEVYEAYQNFIYTDNDLLTKLYSMSIKKDTLEPKVETKNIVAPKTNMFLRKKEVDMSYEAVMDLVKNKSRSGAVESLKQVLRLDEKNCNTLLDLIVEETKRQILVDVDKDGFVIQKDRRKRQYK